MHSTTRQRTGMVQRTPQSKQPLLTLALFAFNQEAFIAEAVKGALAQTYSPLEIILSDDCSVDGTYERMQTIVNGYRGPHHVVIRQNDQNLGLAAHINRVMRLIRGEFVIVAAGDDISHSDRVEKLYRAIRHSKKVIRSIYSNRYMIDSLGNRLSVVKPPKKEQLSLKWFAERRSGVIGSTQAWHRDIFGKFGDMDEAVIHEDMVVPFRAALLGDVAYVDEPLVSYRVHDNNMHLESRFSSRHEFQEHFRCFVRDYEAVCLTRLRDLDVARRLSLQPRPVLDWLEQTTRRNLVETQMEARLIEASQFDRMSTSIRSVFLGVPPRRAFRWFLSYSFPRSYFVFLRRYNRLRRNASL